jgi:hypothetical protein
MYCTYGSFLCVLLIFLFVMTHYRILCIGLCTDVVHVSGCLVIVSVLSHY